MNSINNVYLKITSLNKYLGLKEQEASEKPYEDFKKLKSKLSEKVILEKLDINSQIFSEFEISIKSLEKHKNDTGVLYDISFLRSSIYLSIIGTKIGHDFDIIFNNPKSNESLSLKQVRAIELIIRALVTEHNGGKQGILNKLNQLFKTEIIQSWLKNADETGVLSGTSFNELSALFLDKKMFISYDDIFENADGLKYERNKIDSLRYFLNDIRIIRNNIAHNKKILLTQIELLNIYYNEIIGKIQDAFDKGKTIVDTRPYMTVEESNLNEYLSNIKTEFESVKSEITELKTLSSEIKTKTRINTRFITIAFVLIGILSFLLFLFRTELGIVSSKVEIIEKKVDYLDTKIDETIEDPYKLAVNDIKIKRNLRESLHYLDFYNNKRDEYSVSMPLTKRLFVKYWKAMAYFKLKAFGSALNEIDSCLIIDKCFIRGYLLKNDILVSIDNLNNDSKNENEIVNNYKFILSYSRKDAGKFNKEIFRRFSENNTLYNSCKDYNASNCDFYSLSWIMLGESDGDMLLSFNRKIYVLNILYNYYNSNKEYKKALDCLKSGINNLLNEVIEIKDSYYGEMENLDYNISFTESKELSLDKKQLLLNKFGFFILKENDYSIAIKNMAYNYYKLGDPKNSLQILENYILLLSNWKDNSESYLENSKSILNVDLFYIYDAAYKICKITNNEKLNLYKKKAIELFSIPKVKTAIDENNNACGFQPLNLDFSNYENFTQTELKLLAK